MRIGINVSNDLLKQIRKINPEVNVSQICRDALEEYVSKSERAQEFFFANYAQMEETAKMLANTNEPPLIPPDWVGMALEDARDWVRTVSPGEWKRFFSQYDFIAKRDGKEKANVWAEFATGAKGFHEREREHDEYINLMLDHDIDFSTLECQKIYNAAWMSFVLKVRQIYQDYSKSERDRIIAERRAAWQSVTPELPTQLLD